MIFYHEANTGHDGGLASRPAALLFHGLTGGPEEMRPLAELLYARGFDVSVPLLTGHESCVEDLCKVRADSWILDAQNAFMELKSRRPSALFVVGLSFGSFLALSLAARSREEIKALVLLAAPFEISPRAKEIAVQLLSYLPDSLLDRLGTVKKKERPEWHFPMGRSAYDAHSTAAVARTKAIARSFSPGLKRITCPVLVLQDPNDHHLSERSLRILQRRLSSADITQRWLPGAEHEMTIGPRAAEVNEMVVDFLQQRL